MYQFYNFTRSKFYTLLLTVGTREFQNNAGYSSACPIILQLLHGWFGLKGGLEGIQHAYWVQCICVSSYLIFKWVLCHFDKLHLATESHNSNKNHNSLISYIAYVLLPLYPNIFVYVQKQETVWTTSLWGNVRHIWTWVTVNQATDSSTGSMKTATRHAGKTVFMSLFLDCNSAVHHDG